MVSTFSPQSRKLAQTLSKYVKVIYLIVDQFIFNHCLQGQSYDQSLTELPYPVAPLFCFGFILDRSLPLDRRKSNKILSKSTVVCKFTTNYSHMRSNSKARISGLAVSTHVRNRTLPDLPSAWPWEIWVRD